MATMTVKMTGTEFLARTSRQDFRVEGFRPVGNEDCAASMREAGRSSATQRHQSKKFKGSRSANKKSAIRNGGW